MNSDKSRPGIFVVVAALFGTALAWALAADGCCTWRAAQPNTRAHAKTSGRRVAEFTGKFCSQENKGDDLRQPFPSCAQVSRVMTRVVDSPDHFHLQAAEGWLGLGNHLEASSELTKISPANQSDPAVLALRWHIWADQREWREAFEMAERLIAAAPDQVQPWIWLAYSARRMEGGGIPEAKAKLLEAAKRFPEDALVRYNLGCYEAQLGNREEALRYLGEAFKLGDRKHLKAMAMADPDLEALRAFIMRM
jgi:tetratricopeptide (TPR) repeat protein